MDSFAALPALPSPLSRADAWRRFRWPALVCLALLVWGYARTSPGTKFEAPWGYRTWSFAELAYSDIIALHDDRGGGLHQLPYVQDKIEYPVLLGVAMWLPSVAAPNRGGYFALTYLWIALSALGVLWILCAFPGTQPWIFAGSPALLVYAPLNWDLIGALPLALGLYAWSRDRDRAAAAWLAIATCFKLFPILALWLLLVTALRKSVKHAVTLGAIALGIALAINLPFALAPDPVHSNWAWFFEYSRIREIEPSLYLLLTFDARAFAQKANVVSSLIVATACFALGGVELRTRRLPILPALMVLFAVFFIVNKVYSPQYWLWVVLALALAGGPASLGVAAGAMALVDYVGSFAHLHVQMQRIGHVTGWYQQHVFWPMVSLRYTALAVLGVWGAVQVWLQLARKVPSHAEPAQV